MNPVASRCMLPFVVGAILCLSACTTGQPVIGPAGQEPRIGAELPNALQVSDIPIPNGAKFDSDSSLIIGTSDGWLGRLVIKTDLASVQAFNHYHSGMPPFGWSLVTAVQARISTLTYLRGERVASIQIEPSSISGSTVSITVSIRQGVQREPGRPKPL